MEAKPELLLDVLRLGALLTSRQEMEQADPTTFLWKPLAEVVRSLQAGEEGSREAAAKFLKRWFGVDRLVGTIIESAHDQGIVNARTVALRKELVSRAFFVGTKREFLEREHGINQPSHANGQPDP